MKMSKKLAAPLIATSLLLSGGAISPLSEAHASVQVSQYQKDLNSFATHYATILRTLENYQTSIENTEDEDKLASIYDAYMSYFDGALENTAPIDGLNQDILNMDTYIYDSLVEIYNFEIDTLDYQAGDLTESQWKQAETAMNDFVDEQNILFQKAASSYKNKYNASYSNDMLYLLDIEDASMTYVVKKGDTLYSIAKKYKTSVVNLKELNHLTGNTLKVGQALKIPGGASTPPTTPSLAPNTYSVKKGDTLTSISKKYNTTVSALKKWNNLKSDQLKIGQIVKVKAPDVKYTVQKGDTLYKVSKKYNISVVQLKKVNNLTSDTLKIGQVLKVNL
ncbi:LysM peptidoglycan-binding domain-containing protein [[Brevibacterium] frigoritolerans]|nr:LysM peptidoglycan-binding domain-containing protein [Peribacillus frigoritolerans]